jgi:hypothetical protein
MFPIAVAVYRPTDAFVRLEQSEGNPMSEHEKPRCGTCRQIRLALICCLIGGGAGFLTLQLGLGSQLSMLATFLGAFIPFAWHVRKDSRDSG